MESGPSRAIPTSLISNFGYGSNTFQRLPKVHEADVSEEGVQSLERAARTTLLARARALRTTSGQSASASFDLSAIFCSLGAMGQPLALRARDLQEALVNIWRQYFPAVSCLQMDDNTFNAAAHKLAARLAGTDVEEGGMDYRRFEDWLCPPRRLAELRSKLIELVTGGTLGGMTGTELFNQLRGCAIGGSRVENAGKGLGRLELRQGLEKLGLRLTETEVDELMEGAVCSSKDKGYRGRFTPEMLHSLVGIPLDGHDRSDEAREDTLRIPGMSAVALVNPQPAESRATETQAASRVLEPRQHFVVCNRGEEECFTPDSLERTVSPPMSLSELEVVKGPNIPGYAASTSSALHAESSRRKAAGVQEKPTNIALSGERPIGRRGIRGPGSNARGYDDAVSKLAEGNNETDAKKGGDQEVPDRTANAWLPHSDSRSFLLRHATTPPMGPALSPPERQHPTRASRERLEAVHEVLDLEDHLKPIAEGTKRANMTKRARSAGARLSDDSKGKRGSWHREASPSAGRPTIKSVTALSKAKRSGNLDITEDVDAARTPQVSGEGKLVVDGRRTATIESTATGVAKSRLEADRGVGFSLMNKRSGMNGPGVTRRDGDVSDEGISEDSIGDGSKDAPEVIGRLRARVAELELTEQLLRCELEGARADLAANARRTDAKVKEAGERAEERESAIRAKMCSRLREAEAEAAATQKRIIELKRSSAAEAAVRDKASAEYLRRRSKEMEASLEAKIARRLANQQQRTTESCLKCRKDSACFEGGGGRVQGSVSRSRAQGTSSRDESRGEAEKGTLATFSTTTAKVHEELRACRKKLAAVTAEVSRLRVQATRGTRGLRRSERRKGELQDGEKPGIVPYERSKGATGVKNRGHCAKCRGERTRIRVQGGILNDSRQRWRERQQQLEQKLSESEDARIEAETEASRLQAFIDEMRGLGRPEGMSDLRGGERTAEKALALNTSSLDPKR